MSDIKIKEVEVLRGLVMDVIVYTYPGDLNDAKVNLLSSRLSKEFPLNRVLILDGGANLSVTRNK